MNDLERQIRDALLRHEADFAPFEIPDVRRVAGRARRRQARNLVGGALGVVIVALATGSILVRSLTLDGMPVDRPVEPKPAPAASGSLAYDLEGDIYIADPDGSNAVKIADGEVGEYWAEGPMWSPDGRYPAYRHHTSCSSSEIGRDVVISDAEGHVIATFPAQGWGVASPDSRRVAVWDCLYEPPATIGVYGLDGARLRQLTMSRSANKWRPAFTAALKGRWRSLLRSVAEPRPGGGTPRLAPSPRSRCQPNRASLAPRR
jgi:hypothetical protein